MGVEYNLKKEGRKYRIFFQKIGGLRTFCQICSFLKTKWKGGKLSKLNVRNFNKQMERKKNLKVVSATFLLV